MKSRLSGFLLVRLTCAGFCAAGALLATGCKSSSAGREFAALALSPPQPPIFLKGPAGLLLTNSDGFSARVTLEPALQIVDVQGLSGQLLGQGSSLMFLPDPDKRRLKGVPDPGIEFIWDVAQERGYVLSEAMQSYAPISSSRQFTNVVAGGSTAVPGRLEGYSCAEQDFTVFATDGSTTLFQVWRAEGLKQLPLRISSPVSSAAFTLKLSSVKLGPVPSEQFRPPAGFKSYDSVEAMMTEMALRQENLHRPSPSSWIESSTPSAPQPRQPR